MAGHKVVKAKELLKFVKSVNWETAARTFGNSHCTLIGLLVDAWIKADCDRHWALEGAPALEKGSKTLSDGIFVRDNDPVGILEVEGRYPLKSKRQKRQSACEKISNYLRGNPSLFGLCVFYPIYPRGRKGEEQLYFIHRENRDEKYEYKTQIDRIRKEVSRIGETTDSLLMAVFVEKEYQSNDDDLVPNIELRRTARNGKGYGRGKVRRIFADLIEGNVVRRKDVPLWRDV